eukprot:scaffold8275_cov61-Phaeocystis_antarctica.AAC.12
MASSIIRKVHGLGLVLVLGLELGSGSPRPRHPSGARRRPGRSGAGVAPARQVLTDPVEVARVAN